MLQIKTIVDQYANRFDERVNEALADGWTLTKRYYTPDNFFVAELERVEITEEERCCENCKHYHLDPDALPCRDCNDGPLEGWEPTDA